MANLAFMWKGQGQDMEAISLMTECVQRQQRALGVNHPDSIFCSIALAEWKTEDAGTGNDRTSNTASTAVAENRLGSVLN
jgi:hypothetical protein